MSVWEQAGFWLSLSAILTSIANFYWRKTTPKEQPTLRELNPNCCPECGQLNGHLKGCSLAKQDTPSAKPPESKPSVIKAECPECHAKPHQKADGTYYISRHKKGCSHYVKNKETANT